MRQTYRTKTIALALTLALVATAATAQKPSMEARKLQLALFAITNLYVDSTDESKLVEDAITGMLDKLDRIGIPLQTVRHVDALPIEAFEGGTFRTNMKAKAIREHYFNSIDEPAPKTDEGDSD